MSNNVEEARKLVTQAKKKLKGGFFSSRNPDAARACYEDAIKLLRRVRPASAEVQDLFIQVLDECSKLNYELNSFLGAAKNFEEASRIAKKMGNIERAADLFSEASLMWRENGQYEKSVEAKMNAAKLVKELDQDKALQLMHEALEVVEEEDRAQFNRDVYDEAITYAVRSMRLKTGAEFLDRQTQQYEKMGQTFRNKLHSNRLAIIILYLAEGGQEGRQRAIEALNHACVAGDGFMQWDGFELTDGLVEAFKKGEAGGEEMAALVRSGDIGIFTKGSIAWLSKRLTTEGLPAMYIGPLDAANLDAPTSDLAQMDVGDGDEPDFT